jgi:hypothetical protein
MDRSDKILLICCAMNLARISTHFPSSIQLSSVEINGAITIAAAIVDMVSRNLVTVDQQALIQNLQEMRAERYRVLSQGLGLLCAAMGGFYLESNIVLTEIGLVVVTRLYALHTQRTHGNVVFSPLPKLFTTFLMVTKLYLMGNLALEITKVHSCYRDMMLAVIAVLSICEPLIVDQLFHINYFKSESFMVIASKIESVYSFFISINGMAAAAWAASTYLCFKEASYQIGDTFWERGVDKVAVITAGIFFVLTSVGWFGRLWFFVDIYWTTLFDFNFAQNLPDSCKQVRDLLCRAAYTAPGYLSLIDKAFHKLAEQPTLFPAVFSHYARYFTAESFADIIKAHPNHLNADYLFDNLSAWHQLWNELWTKLSDQEIQTYLLLPGIKQTNSEIDQAIDSVNQKYTDLTSQATFIDLRYRFENIRPWLEELNTIDEQIKREDNFLQLMPQSSKPIVASLQPLKSDLRKKREKISQLESKLETYCDLAVDASECLAALKEADMAEILTSCNRSSEGGVMKAFFHHLFSINIKWKGDLVLSEIWDAQDNTPEALKSRLMPFFKTS